MTELTTECFARTGKACEGYLTRTCRHCGRPITMELLRAQAHLSHELVPCDIKSSLRDDFEEPR